MRRYALVVSCLLVVSCVVPAAASARSAYFFGNFIGGGPSSQEQETPTPTSLTEVVAVQASNDSDYALKSDGTVWAWGNDEMGQLGDGTGTSSATPVQVAIPGGEHIVAIGQARNEGVAISSTGKVFGWGEDSFFSLCIPARPGSLKSPVEIPSLSGEEIVAESGGGAHTLWLKKNGEVLACGNRGSSGLGPNGRAPLGDPTPIPGLEDIVEISGSGAAGARTESGEVFMWGSNEHGQVGVGSSSETVLSPTRVSLPGPATQVASGGDTLSNGSSGAVVGGKLYMWGDDQYGQLGDGQRTNETTPIATGLEYSHIAIAGVITLGLTASGELQGFGNGSHGMLGTGLEGGSVLTPTFIQSDVQTMSDVAQASVTIH